MGHEFDPNLSPEQKAVKKFFINYDADRPWWKPRVLSSGWKGNRKDVTLEQIILHAMKEPTNKDGTKGNRTAKILYSKFDLLVEKNASISTPPNQNDILYNYKNLFYQEWKRIRKDETNALTAFYLLRKNQIALEAMGGCGSRLRHSHLDRYEASNSEEKAIPEIKPSLAHLVEMSRPGYFRWFMAKLRCPTFFSGGRSHLIFKDIQTMLISDSGKSIAEAPFNIDTRSDKRSTEEITKEIIERNVAKNSTVLSR